MVSRSYTIQALMKGLGIFCLLISFSANSQKNWVRNNSFEQFINCPSTYPNITLPNPWFSPTNLIGNSYLNTCSIYPETSIPNYQSGIQGYQNPKTGNGCGWLFYLNGGNTRDYTSISLTRTLQSNRKYYCEYFVNLADNTGYACNNIGMLFTNTPVYVDTANYPYGVLPANPQILGYGNPVVKDTQNWVKISGIYKALGGERILTLGNFKYDNQTTKMVNNPNGYNGASYLIDDVSVIPLDSMCLPADAGKDTTINAGDSVFVGSYTNGIDTIKWYNQAGQVIDSIAPGFWVKPTTNTTYYVEQIVNGCFTRDTINVTVKPLPLHFIYVGVQHTPNPSQEGRMAAKIDWITANEINVLKYEVQRSTNARDFATIGTVSAKNFASNEYSFVDDLKTKDQMPKTLFYRIVGIDKDGKKTYSIIKSINIQNATTNITVFPNPAKDYINIEGKDIKEIKLINQLGQVVKQQSFSTPTNSVLWRVGDAKGMYILNIVTTKGDIVNEKIIIE